MLYLKNKILNAKRSIFRVYWNKVKSMFCLVLQPNTILMSGLLQKSPENLIKRILWHNLPIWLALRIMVLFNKFFEQQIFSNYLLFEKFNQVRKFRTLNERSHVTILSGWLILVLNCSPSVFQKKSGSTQAPFIISFNKDLPWILIHLIKP